MSLAGVGAGSPSPTARRLAQTNPAMTTVTSLIHSDTPSRHASFTQGQMYDTNTPYSPQSSITESYCRHCGEGFDSIPSSRRSSTRIKETRSSQTDIVDIEDYEEPVVIDKRYTWQRSASCKELIGMKTRTFEVKTVERTLEAPVTRYDDSQRSCYSIAGSKTPSIDRSTVDVPETKVYSSSYPGTTSSLSTESGGGEEGGLEPGGSVLVIDTGSSREEIILSHDDLSHDSYELLERDGALLYGDSRSCSLDSAGDQLPDDEIFLMDDDYDTRDGSDVEKRLGYVEPRYGDIGFNEFNEKCKQGFAIKRAVEFGEFDAKCKPGMVIGFDDEVSSTGLNHYPVERTKSDPYVSDFWKVAKQHRRLLHQKSIDLTPTEPSGVDSSSYLGSSSLGVPSGSKSVVDIPYTLYKRHHMNGTATEKSFDYKSPQLLSPAKLSPVAGRKSPIKSPEVVRKEKTKSPKRNGESGRLSKTKMKPDLNSQDSGLSLSLGTESADDLQDIFSRNDNNLIDLNKDDPVDTIIYKQEVVDVEVNFKESVVGNVKKIDLLTVPDEVTVRDKSGKKDLVKGKSEDTTKSKKGTLTKSRQVHSADSGLKKDCSFEKRDAAVKVIKIDSGSSEAVCLCDRKDLKRKDIKTQSLENPDPDVIIVEYRGNRKRAFQKRSSSGSKDSIEKDIKRSGSLDAPKSDKKSKDTRLVKSRSNSREEKKKSKPDEKTSKEQIMDKSTEVQIVERKESKSENKEFNDVITIKNKNVDTKDRNEVILQQVESLKIDQTVETIAEISKTDPKDQNKDDDKSECSVKKSVTTPETTWKKFGDLPAPISHKRERSPILFARLGLSEGSVPTHRQSSLQSPSSSRRAKSLDAPVVSLHRLPPVTSFSSKDDTVDNDENIELEEKTLRQSKSLKPIDVILKDSIQEECYTEPSLVDNNTDCVMNVRFVNVELSEVKSNGTHAIDIPSRGCSKSDNIGGKDEEVISATLEKLDEVVDRVKVNGLLRDVPSNTTTPIKDKSLNLSPLSPTACFSPTRSFSPTGRFSPNQLTPTRRSSSPIRDLPSSPIKNAPLSPLSMKDAPLSPSLKDAPLSPTIIEPPLSPSAERRPSTRQERLDSFKKTYSVDIWTSDEGDAPGVPAFEIEHVDYTSNDYDDEIFVIEPQEEDKEKENCKEIKQQQDEEETKGIESESDVFEEHLDSGKATGNEVVSTTEDECWVSVEDIQEMVKESTETNEAKCSDKEDSLKDDNIDVSKVISESDTNKLEQTIKEFMEVIQPIDEPSTSGLRLIPEKRSFDEEPSSSSSIKQVELSSTWKPFPLESSGSSSLEEGIFPPDDTGHYADEEEGSSHSNGQDEFPTGFGYPMTGAEMMISGYTGSMFGLSRTLSRISERSTTSEQERSDFEDDISTKPSSRSLSVDDESLLSSDRQPSLSSDPPSGPNLEDQPLPDLPPLPKEPIQEPKLDFKIPPPLLPTASEEDWPSPPNSSPFDTPVISHVETFYMEIKPEEATKVVVIETKDTTPEGNESSTDENKTLQEEYIGGFDDSTIQDGTVKLAMRPKASTGVHGNSASEDTSIGISDWSSSTSTVKHCQYYSCAVKSDDSSLADFGLSLSTETISGRKSSDDSLAKFQVKRQGMFTVPPQRSFDDYDSPYSESDEGQAKPVQKRNQHSFYASVSSPTSTLAVKKCQDRSKFNRSGLKCTPYYSAPTPVSHEHRDVSELLERRSSSKSIARSKCYSYYSLARSPPSDGSSSSLDNPEPPTTPNTIPRVSKRRRHIPPTKRRHRVSVDMEVRDGHIVSVSSPSVVAYGRNRHPTASSDRDLVVDPARQHSTSCSKQSSV